MTSSAALVRETFEPRDLDASAQVYDFGQQALRRGRGVAEPVARLTSPDGHSIELPDELFQVLMLAAESLSQNKAVTVAPVDLQLTTQEAADFLGLSRPTLVKMLERGEIAFSRIGRHRRVTLADLITYQRDLATSRRASLQEMADISRDTGLYEATAVDPTGIR